MAQGFAEVFEALSCLQEGLESQGVKAKAVELENNRSGVALMHLLDETHRTQVSLTVAEFGETPFRQVSVAGIIVRWPAKKVTISSTSYEWM